MQLEKLTQEQRKMYDGLMNYDFVMTKWLNEAEENRAQYKSNPIKTFLAVTGMKKDALIDMMSPLANKEVLSKRLGEEEDFTLEEANTSYTNGWDIVNLATLDIVNLALSKLFSDEIKINVPLVSEDQTANLNMEATIGEFKFDRIDNSLASMTMVLKDCTVSGVLSGDSINLKMNDITFTFQVELEQISLETESGKNLELYLDLHGNDVITNINVKVDCENFLLQCVLDEILPVMFQEIVKELPVNEPYKICTVDIDEETQNKMNWLIPDYANFSGSAVLDNEGVEKREMAVFAKTLDKNVDGLNLDIEQAFTDGSSDGTMGITEKIVLGYILPICISSAVKKDKSSAEVPPMNYDENENCLNVDHIITEESDGVTVSVKDFKITSREGGFRLGFFVDGNWAGMIDISGTGFLDIRFTFTKDEDGGHLYATVSNPTIDYSMEVEWWVWLVMAVLIITVFGIILAAMWGIILGVATAIIDNVMDAIRDNGIDGLPFTMEIPIRWNNLQALDMQSMSFSKGIRMSYSMRVAEEDIER